jgi:hypothetical protein
MICGVIGKLAAQARTPVLCLATDHSERAALRPDIGSYERPARRWNSARSSRTLIPIALAVVSARLSLGPRSIPIAASREASNSAADSAGATGAGNLGIDFSIRAIRDLSLVCIFQAGRSAFLSFDPLSFLIAIFRVTPTHLPPLSCRPETPGCRSTEGPPGTHLSSSEQVLLAGRLTCNCRLGDPSTPAMPANAAPGRCRPPNLVSRPSMRRRRFALPRIRVIGRCLPLLLPQPVPTPPPVPRCPRSQAPWPIGSGRILRRAL